MPVSIQCPHCSARIRAEEDVLGLERPCPKCQQTFIVSDADAAGGAPTGDNNEIIQLDIVADDQLEPLGEPELLDGTRTNSELEPIDASDPFAAMSPESDPFAALSPATGNSSPGNEINPSDAFPSAPISALSNAQVPIGRPAGQSTGQSAQKPAAAGVPQKMPSPLVVGLIAGGGLLAVMLCVGAGLAAWFLMGDGGESGETVVADQAPVEIAQGDSAVIVQRTTTSSPERITASIGNATPASSPAPNSENAAVTLDKAATLESLKAATVYIQVEDSKGISSGSGFLLQRDGNSGLVITNSHVVESKGGRQKITCVFHSGLANQSTAVGNVVGVDEPADLAVLRVDHDSLPEPLQWESKVTLGETMPVLTLGFPLGAGLATNSRGPAITVSKGSVTSIRRDESNNVVLIQVDGGINPGNSGGPVVTENGQLIGIAVAKISGADIGFAIAKRLLTHTLAGRVTEVKVGIIEQSTARHRYRINADIVDPKNLIVSATMLTCPADRWKELNADPDGSWPRVNDEMKSTGMSIRKLSMNKKSAVADIITPPEDTIFQLMLIRKDKSQWFSEPAKFTPVSPAAVAGNSRSAPQPRRPQSPRIERPGSSDTPVAVKQLAADGKSLVEHLVWSRDGSAVFAVSKVGTIYKFDLESNELLLTQEFNSACSYLGRSQEGLVLVMNAVQQVWSIDEESLEVKQKIRMPSSAQIACCPTSSFVYVPTNNTIASVDLRSGKIRELTIHVQTGRNSARRNFEYLTLSPDGKYLFAESGIEALTRMRVGNDAITIEQYSPRIGSNSRDISVSSDSRFVAMPAGGGNGRGYSTYVYAVEDLQTPAVVIESGAYPVRIAFDPVANRVYAQNHDVELIVFNMGGVKRGQYRISGSGRALDVRRFLTHPEGKRLCVLTDAGLFFVDVPGPTEEPLVTAPSLATAPNSGSSPTVTAPTQANPAPTRVVADLRVMDLELDAKDQVGQLVWSRDHSHVFALTKQGLLQKFSVVDGRVITSVDLASKCSYLGNSREGLVVVFDSLQKVASIDENSLKVKRELKVGGAHRIGCAAVSSLVYMTSNDGLLAINLASGSIKKMPLLAENESPMDARAVGRLRFLTLSPNGKYLFCADGNALLRIRITRGRASIEDRSARISSAGREIVVSPDSRYVAYLSGGGNRAENHPNIGYGTYVYEVDDLQLPKLGIATGAYPVNLGFDVVTHKFYAQNHERQLIVVNEGGINEGDYALDRRGSNVRCFLVHPQGQRVCILTDTKLLWVELGLDLPPLNTVATAGSSETPTRPFRTWTDTTGSFRVSARLVAIRGEIAVVEKTDGNRAEVPIARLSQADQDYLAAEK